MAVVEVEKEVVEGAGDGRAEGGGMNPPGAAGGDVIFGGLGLSDLG